MHSLPSYIEETPFKVQTQNNALKLMLTYIDLIWRLMRERLKLSDFDHEVSYCLSLVHHVPDALSRLLYPFDSGFCKSIDDVISKYEYSPNAFDRRLKKKEVPVTSLSEHIFRDR